MEFKLDERLNNDGDIIAELKLCLVILVNNSYFPWVILIPKIAELREIIDLNNEDSILLMKEIRLVSNAITKIFNPDKLNIAALGNIVPQLHVHIVARYEEDRAWPAPVFGKEGQAYEEDEYKLIMEKIRASLLT